MVRIITAKFLRTSAKSFPLFLAMVIFPLMMTFFMGMVMSAGQPEGMAIPRVEVAYYNADSEMAGQQFHAYLTGLGERLSLQELDETGFQSVRANNAFAVAVYVPSDFTRWYGSGEPTAIQVIRGYGSWSETAIVTGIVRDFTEKMNTELALRQVMGDSSELSETLRNRDYLDLMPRAPELAPIQFFAASTLVMFLLLAGATGAIRFINEREENTLLRIYAGPVTRNQALLGNLLGQLIITLIQAALIIGAGTRLFGIYWGSSLAGLIGITAATAFVATALAFLFAFLFNSARLAGGAIPVLVLIMSFVSGGMTGMEGLSPVFRQLSDFTLNKWAINAYTSLMQGQGSGSILTNLMVLTGAGVVLTGLAIILANRREAFYE